MQIDQIKAFVRCAELGTLSAASRAERVPKSTLSRLLAELERELKVRLLDRSPRGVVLTEKGRTFLTSARRVLEEVERAAAVVLASDAGLAGVVRITAPYTFGVTFIAPLLPAFFERYPAINVHLELTSRNVDLIEEGYDLAVRIGPPPPALVARRLMNSAMILCATPDYLARRGEPTSIDRLADHPLLLIGSSRSSAALKLQRADQSHLVTTSPKLLSSDPGAILRATLGGAGIGQVPFILSQDLLASGALARVLADWTLLGADISIIFPSSRALMPRVKAFVDFTSEALRPFAH